MSAIYRYLAGILLVAAAALLALPALSAAEGQPTLTTIALDGSFDDWQTVFANTFNTVFDGDGSSIACGDSSDRDCIVPSSSSDLSGFAFTWDDQNLYLYVERFASANNKNFNVFLDVNDDGMLDSNDLVLVHAFKASQQQIQPALHYYFMQAGTPDPIVDALGFGDGYSIPGGIGNSITNPSVPGDCTLWAALRVRSLLACSPSSQQPKLCRHSRKTRLVRVTTRLPPRTRPGT